jgi:CDP-diacylglycerol--glycerol-3-phosphate 3-phosphatidyltransferase
MAKKSPDGRDDKNVHSLDEFRKRIAERSPSWMRKPKPPGKPPTSSLTPEEEARRFRSAPLMEWVRKYIYLKTAPWVRHLMLRVPRWITPNGITLFRGMLVFPAAHLLLTQQYWAALLVLKIAFILDFVDGALAEARKEWTLFGAFADPLMDKVLVGGALLALWNALDKDFHAVIIANIAFAVAITGMRVVKMRFPKIAARLPGIAATLAGKIKFNMEVVSVLALILGLALTQPWMLTAAFVLLTLSIFLAGVSFFTQFVGHKGP